MSQPTDGQWYQASDGKWYCWPNPTAYDLPPTPAQEASAAAAPTPVVSPSQPQWSQQVVPQNSPGGDQRPFYQKKRYIIPTVVVVLAIVGGAIGGSNNKKNPASTTTASTTSPASAPQGQTAAEKKAAEKEAAAAAAKAAAAKEAAARRAAAALGPASEQAFNAAVNKGKTGYDNSSNAIRQGEFQSKRNRGVCDAVPDLTATSWVGSIDNISTNGSGKGVLELRIGPNTKVSTWNNSFSDIEDNTLIPQSSRVYRTLANLKSGDRVRFSGTFFHDSSSCLEEQSLTQEGKMDSPTFVFRFTSVKPE